MAEGWNECGLLLSARNAATVGSWPLPLPDRLIRFDRFVHRFPNTLLEGSRFFAEGVKRLDHLVHFLWGQRHARIMAYLIQAPLMSY